MGLGGRGRRLEVSGLPHGTNSPLILECHDNTGDMFAGSATPVCYVRSFIEHGSLLELILISSHRLQCELAAKRTLVLGLRLFGHV